MASSYEFFNELYQLFGSDKQNNPEKFDLYNGLCALSQELALLRTEVRELRAINAEIVKQLAR